MSGIEHLRGSILDPSLIDPIRGHSGVFWVIIVLLGLLNVVSFVMSLVQASNLKDTAILMASMEAHTDHKKSVEYDICARAPFIDIKVQPYQSPLHVSRSVDNLLTHRIKKNL